MIQRKKDRESKGGGMAEGGGQRQEGGQWQTEREMRSQSETRNPRGGARWGCRGQRLGGRIHLESETAEALGETAGRGASTPEAGEKAQAWLLGRSWLEALPVIGPWGFLIKSLKRLKAILLKRDLGLFVEERRTWATSPSAQLLCQLLFGDRVGMSAPPSPAAPDRVGLGTSLCLGSFSSTGLGFLGGVAQTPSFVGAKGIIFTFQLAASESKHSLQGSP